MFRLLYPFVLLLVLVPAAMRRPFSPPGMRPTRTEEWRSYPYNTKDKPIRPALNTFLAFPTTLIIDKKGTVARIHTGYSGPATGIYYQQFVKEFNEEIDRLL